MNVPRLSIVVPLYNEEHIVDELIRRILAATDQCGWSFELVPVDDCSTDGTGALLERWSSDSRIRPVRLRRNCGQFRATCEGMMRARGAWVIVLDGDLQDPPETIPALTAAVAPNATSKTVIFAVKTDRDDPAWFVVGRSIYATLTRALASEIPDGAGSYCLISRQMGRNIAAIPLRDVNLATVIVGLGGEATTVEYVKNARYDGRSRVGPVALVREAIGSLFVLSPLGRLWLRGRVDKVADRSG